MAKAKVSVELEDLQKAMKISKLYFNDRPHSDRNPNLAHLVHATLHFIQFLVVMTMEIFHHVYYVVHKFFQDDDINLPIFYLEQNYMLLVNLVYMALSLFLCFDWLLSKNFRRNLYFSMAGCIIQTVLSFINAIVIMRQAQTDINHEVILEEHIIEHPNFIHCFTICMFSVFNFSLNQTQFWLLMDCIQWHHKQKKNKEVNNDRIIRDESHGAQCVKHKTSYKRTTNSHSKSEYVSDFDDFLITDDDRVDLYCCCIDYWNYSKLRKKHIEMNHEFQVVYIM